MCQCWVHFSFSSNENLPGGMTRSKWFSQKKWCLRIPCYPQKIEGYDLGDGRKKKGNNPISCHQDTCAVLEALVSETLVSITVSMTLDPIHCGSLIHSVHWFPTNREIGDRVFITFAAQLFSRKLSCSHGNHPILSSKILTSRVE